MDMEHINFRMEIDMLENGKNMQNMAKENTITTMVNCTLDNGVIIRRMVKEHTSI